jgi:hypothetical protein
MGQYCGVDVSQQAIRDANKFADQRSSWVVSDIESFHSLFKWNAVAMIESIYYIGLNQLPQVLKSVMEMVGESGIFLVRFHDFKKHQAYIEMIQRLYPSAERVESNLLCIDATSLSFNRPASPYEKQERA